MSAVLKSTNPSRMTSAKPPTFSRQTRTSAVSLNSLGYPSRQQPPTSDASDTVVRRLPNSQPMPTWLRSLMKLQRSSLVVTFVLVSSALAVYGWTVYSQQLWGKEYRQLTKLQRAERQFAMSSESLKQEMAKQAERPGTNLVPQSPSNTIFLQPAPLRSVIVPPIATKPVSTPGPLGY